MSLRVTLQPCISAGWLLLLSPASFPFDPAHMSLGRLTLIQLRIAAAPHCSVAARAISHVSSIAVYNIYERNRGWFARSTFSRQWLHTQVACAKPWLRKCFFWGMFRAFWQGHTSARADHHCLLTDGIVRDELSVLHIECRNTSWLAAVEFAVTKSTTGSSGSCSV